MSNFPVRRGYISKLAIISRIIGLVWFFLYCLIVPAYYFGVAHAFGMFLLYNGIFSQGYALLFAVNHWTTEASHVDYNNIGKSNWGVLQVENSTNFAGAYSFSMHYAGGLNLQVINY